MLELTNISLKAGIFSLRSVSFRVNRGDYFILLGVSGAGKSMVLETIAGLMMPHEGTIKLDGRDITREKIQKRGTGLVFQDHAIFPNMTVKENIAYSLHGLHITHAEKTKRIEKMAEKMNISGLLKRRPGNLSGGELQRVALARTLIQEPAVLLLDEPLASLDIQLRAGVRSLLRGINRQGQTIIHVTHDYEEALSLGNRISVIHDGEILQTGTPEEVFQSPRSEFVAHFTGARNFFRARIATEGNHTHAIITDNIRIALPSNPGLREGFIMVRSEDITVSRIRPETSTLNNFPGIVKEIIPSRNGVELVTDVGIPLHALITAESLKNLGITEESAVWLSFKATAIRLVHA
jgi:molybdate/tungstate transport system ATP-binding protein